MSHPDEAGPSAAAATQPDVARPNATAMVHPNVAAPSNVLSVVEARGTKKGPEAVVDEEAPDAKSNPATAVPPSWRK